jgi:BNR repeat-containing family member
MGIMGSYFLFGLLTILWLSSGYRTSSLPSPLPNLATLTKSAVSASPYIKTALTGAETCGARFGETLPRNLSNELKVSAATAPIVYSWNFATKSFSAESVLYGYHPTFSPGRVSFATNGRPMMRDENFVLQVLTDQGTWTRIDLLDAAKQSLARRGIKWLAAGPEQYAIDRRYGDPSVWSESRVVFDRDCNGYSLVHASRSSLGYSLLLHSYDGGHSWAAYRIPGSEGSNTAVRLEVPSGPGALNETPAILLNEFYSTGSAITLRLVVSVKNPDRTLTLSKPIIVAENTISSGGVGGAENYAVSAGDLIHIVYPANMLALDRWSGRHGTAAYAVTVSRSQRRVVTGGTLIDVGVSQDNATAVDDHNQPVIAVDSKGYLHVVVGGHNGPMYYRRSARPNDTSAWTGTEIIGARPSVTNLNADEYTYPSLIVDQFDRPVVAARWAGDGYVFRLVAISKNVSTGTWSMQQTLVDPGRPYYAHWYHKLSIDPRGRIFLNYRYYPDNLFADEAAVLENTYRVMLKNPTNYDGTPCTPTNHDAPVSNYCGYSGYEPLNNIVMMSKGLGLSFELATTKTFFEF